MTSHDPKYVARLAWIVLALNGVLLLAVSHFKSFNPDEFEHIHVSWNMKEGKLVYRDFFDNHGPLLPLLNANLWQLLDLPDDGRTIAAFRVTNLLWPVLAGLLTWSIAATTLGRRHALVAVAVLSTSVTFLEKGVEVRPDGPQVVCWLACVLFLLRAVQAERSRDACLSGLFLGLALAANPKMLTGGAAIAACGALELWFSRDRPGSVLRLGLCVAVGVLAGLLPFVLYFGARGALWEYYYYNFPANFAIARQIQYAEFGPELFRFLRTNLFVLLAALAGAITFLRESELPERVERSRRCLLVLAVVTASFALAGFFSQYFLVFLPLLAVLASHFLVDGIAGSPWKRRGVALLLLLQIGVSLFTWRVLFFPLQRMQLEHLAFVLKHTRKDEPVVLTGMDQPGYVFRPDLQYYWTNGHNLQRVFDPIEGHRVFGERFVERLEEERPTFIVSLDTVWVRRFFPLEATLEASGLSVRSYPEATRWYIARHYVELPGLHLLVRREALSPAMRQEAEQLHARYLSPGP